MNISEITMDEEKYRDTIVRFISNS